MLGEIIGGLSLGELPGGGYGAVTEAPDVILGAGVVAIAGTGALVEEHDTASGSGTAIISVLPFAARSGGMTPDRARAMWRRFIIADGSVVTLRRVGPVNINIEVRARVKGFAPEELVGGITQGHRQVRILAEDVERSGFPVPIKKGSTDRIVVDGKPLMIESVDDNTARMGDTLIGYIITATGA
jgi:hypothetical protein